MRIFVLPLLLSLTLPAGATLVPGSEKPVTGLTRDVAPFNQTAGKLASNGNSFLAVWIDHTRVGEGDIHAARVTPEGKRADEDPLVIAATGDAENRVDVAFGAGRYLVVWSTPAAMQARFVADNGSMSDVIEIAMLSKLVQPRIAFNGNRFLVMWDHGTVFRGAMLDRNGVVTKTFDAGETAQAGFEQALVATNGAFQFITGRVDFGGVPNGNGYPSTVGYATIDDNGNVSARVIVAPATTPVFDVRAVSSGNEFLIGWSTAIGIPGGTVRAVRVSASGPSAIETIPAEDMYLHEVGIDGSGFFVIYGADTTKYLRRLGAREPTILATPNTDTTVLDAARNTARALVLVRGDARVGYEFGPAGGDLYLTRLDTGDIEPLVVAPRHQMTPDVAAAGDLRLAVWCEYIGSDRRLGIIAARLDANGNTLDPNGIDLRADVYHPSAPRVASNGTDWLVTWTDGFGKVFGSRVARNGTLLDAAPFVIATGTYESTDLALSWDGTQYVVVFARGAFFRGLRTKIHAVRVTAQGTIAAPELTLSTEAANASVAIASGTDGSLVMWRSGTVLQGALVSRTGTVTSIGFPTTTTPFMRAIGVAWNGSTYLVATPFTGAFGQEVQWLMVSATGVVTTPLSSFIDAESPQQVEVEGHGGAFLLFWNDGTSVFVARIDGQGKLIEGPRFVTYAAATELAHSIGASGNLFVSARTIAHPVRELARVFARTIQLVQGNPRRRAASH